MTTIRTNVGIQLLVDLFAQSRLDQMPDEDPRKVLLSRDPYALVVRGFPVIEGRLRAALEHYVYEPSCIKEVKLGLMQLARLCAGLGLFDPKYLPAFRSFCKMRHELAHEAGAYISAASMEAFANTATRDICDEYARAWKETAPQTYGDTDVDRFRNAVAALHVIALEAHARCKDNLERRSAPPIYARYGAD